jgi:hypothetical protein
MTHFEAYILTRLDSLQNLFVLAATISFIAFNICLIVSINLNHFKEDAQDQETIDKLRKIIFFIFLPVFLFSSLFLTLTPSLKEMAFIYIAPAIVNNKDVQKTIQKIPELSGLVLEYLNETLKSENKKND